jgi:hypothetical protein
MWSHTLFGMLGLSMVYPIWKVAGSLFIARHQKTKIPGRFCERSIEMTGDLQILRRSQDDNIQDNVKGVLPFGLRTYLPNILHTAMGETVNLKSLNVRPFRPKVNLHVALR